MTTTGLQILLGVWTIVGLFSLGALMFLWKVYQNGINVMRQIRSIHETEMEEFSMIHAWLVDATTIVSMINHHNTPKKENVR